LKTWLAICALLGGGAAAVAWSHGLASPFGEIAADPLAWHAASWHIHPWTLWTAAWVHTSAGNLGANLLVLAALGVAGAALGAGRAAALALALAWPLTTLALLAWPEVTTYAGLGGTIYAAAAVIGVHIARRTTYRPLAVLLFGAVGIKLAAERGWAQPVAFDPSWGFNVVYAAHLAGALIGAWSASVLDWFLAPERERARGGGAG
jgi:membrane associated rhomboid family serine protease